MALAPLDTLLSVKEYLEFEQEASVRHEYVAGTLYALAGATKRHNLIISNLIGQLWTATRDKRGRVYSRSVKVRPTHDLFYYPDVMVTCHGEEDDPLLMATYETEPCLLIEVLSNSTQHVDKREKLAVYRQIKSLQTYLIVHQDRKLIERYWLEAESWQHTQIAEDERVPLTCPNITLSLEEVYEGINL